jgi:hypothetical protein
MRHGEPKRWMNEQHLWMPKGGHSKFLAQRLCIYVVANPNLMKEEGGTRPEKSWVKNLELGLNAAMPRKKNPELYRNYMEILM